MKRYTFLFALLATSGVTAPNNQVMVKKLIHRIIVGRNKIRVVPAFPSLQNFLKRDFVAEYPADVPLKEIDKSILIIPFIANVAPMIWASGKTYSIDRIDRDFFLCLERIQAVFQSFYPSLKWSGKLVAKELVPNVLPKKSDAIAVLFSGGLDAVASSIAHIDRKQELVCIQGSDVKFNDETMWHAVKEQCRSYAETYGMKDSYISSNFVSFMRHSALCSLTPEIKQWWAFTSQALGYTALTAPLVYARGIKHLAIGSSHTHEFPIPYGTHPLIDNEIKFAGCSVHHDLGHLQRLEKIELINNVCTAYQKPTPQLRVCWGKDKRGGNCSNCEKCLRTCNELLLCKQEPATSGFAIQKETVFQRTHELFEKRYFKARQLWHWDVIINRCKDIINKQELQTHDAIVQKQIKWLANQNITEYARNTRELKVYTQDNSKYANAWQESVQKRSLATVNL